MKKLFAGFFQSGGEAVPQDDATKPNAQDTPRRASLLRRRGGKPGGAPPDIIPALITNAAATLADSIQEIISDTAKLSGDNMSGYETLMCILNDTSELDEVGEVIKASGMGCIHLLITHIDHPKFIELCSPISLAAGLFQALRLLRMYEIKQAKTLSEQALLSGLRIRDMAPAVPSTFDASLKICKILEKLCSHSATIEQIRTNLVKILTFPLCILPLNGRHIQQHAAGVVMSICKTGFTSQQVWYLHDVQCITHMVRHLYELTTVSTVSSISPISSNRPASMIIGAESSVLIGNSTDYLLRGLEAEEEGMWLTAMDCFVQVLSATASVGTVLLNDFDSASGNKLFVTILRTSSSARFINMLNIMTVLLFEPAKREEAEGEPQQVLTSFAVMLSDFLHDILGLSTSVTIQMHDSLENLMDVCHLMQEEAGKSQLNEYMIQGMAYALLTIYSNQPSSCTGLEETYNFLPMLLLSLPVLAHNEAISAVLTTLNYVCQCIETPSKMVITALSASTSVLIQSFTNTHSVFLNTSGHQEGLAEMATDHVLQRIDLIVTSVEAICRTNKAYVLVFMKVGLFKYILTDPFEKLYGELHAKMQRPFHENPVLRNKVLIFYQRIILLAIDLNEKNCCTAEDIRRSNILLIVKKIVLVYPLGPTSKDRERHLKFLLTLLRLYEEVSKVDSIHLQESVMVLTGLIQELGDDYDKIRLIYNTLQSICIANEGYFRIFLKENTVRLAVQSLTIAQNAFSTTVAVPTQVSCFHYLAAVLRFLSLILFCTFENENTARTNLYSQIYFSIAQKIVQTAIFQSQSFRGPGLLLVLKFITLFAYDQEIIYPRSLDLLFALLPFLPADLLTLLVQKLQNHMESDNSKFKRMGDIHLVPRLIDNITTQQKELYEILPKEVVVRVMQGNWHCYSLLEVLRSCVKKQVLTNNLTVVLPPRADMDASEVDFFGLAAPNAQSPFEEVAYIAIPLHETSQSDSGSAASLNLFFNESTIAMPTNAITISCWIRIAAHRQHVDTEEGSIKHTLNMMIPVISLESAGSDIHLSVEINPLTSDAVVLCTQGSQSAAGGMEQDLLVFKPAVPLTIDASHWTHCAITMKRMKRFTSASQVQIALFFNGIPWIPHSSLSSTANSPNANAQPGNLSAANSIGGVLSLDPLASGQNGEIRFGLPKDSIYNQGKHSPDKAMQVQEVVLHVAAVCVYAEHLTPKQIAGLFIHGPGYLKLQNGSDAPLTEGATVIATRLLNIANEVSKNALVFVDKLGYSGVETFAEPRVDTHGDMTTHVEMPVLPAPVAAVHPFFTAPEHIAIHGLSSIPDQQDRGDALGEDAASGGVLFTKARFGLCTLLNAADLDNGAPLATLSAGGYISRSMSVGDCASLIGGPDVLFPLLLYANTEELLCKALFTIREHLINNISSLKYMQAQGYRMMSFILSNLPREFMTVRVMQHLIRFAVATSFNRSGGESMLVVDTSAMMQLVCNHYVWDLKSYSICLYLLQFFKGLVSDEKYGPSNIVKLTCLGSCRWILQLTLAIVQFHGLRQNRVGESDVWIYEPKMAYELADYRDDPILFMKLCVDIVRALLQSEIKARDLDLVVSVALYTFLPPQNAPVATPSREDLDSDFVSNLRPFSVGSNATASLDEEEGGGDGPRDQNSHLHPYCTYSETSAEVEPRYLTALEVFRIYLLRLLFSIYDDNLEELRRHNRRPSIPKALNAKDMRELNAASNPMSPVGTGTAPAGNFGETEAFNIFRQTVAPHILIGMLEQSTDVATSTYILRLLTFLLQKDSIFNKDFIAQKGYQVLHLFVNAKHQIEIPVLLPLISILFRIPIQLLMHPYQIKHVNKVIQLVDLEESLGPNVQDVAVMETSIPMLLVLYDCLRNLVKFHSKHSLVESTMNGGEDIAADPTLRWFNNMKDLLLCTIEYALEHCSPFKALAQHLFALEIHIDVILACTNAYSEFGTVLYPEVTNLADLIQEDYISSMEPSVKSSAPSSPVPTSSTGTAPHEMKSVEIEVTNEIGHYLLRFLERIFVIGFKEYENTKLLYHCLVLFNTQAHSVNYEASYQVLIMKTLKKVLDQLLLVNTTNTSIDNALVVVLNRNVILLLPLVRAGFLHFEAIFFLLEVLMEVFVKYVTVFKSMLSSNKNVGAKLQSNVTLDAHQTTLKELNLNIRFLVIFGLHFAVNPSVPTASVLSSFGVSGASSKTPSATPTQPSGTEITTNRYALLTFVKHNVDNILYYIMEDSMDPNILRYVNSNKMLVLNNENIVEKAMNTNNLLVLEAIANITSNAKNVNKSLLASNVYANNIAVTSISSANSPNNLYNNNMANYNTGINMNTYKLERNKVTNIFLIYMIHYCYHLVLEEDSNTRIQATRIISMLSNKRKAFVELLLSNNILALGGGAQAAAAVTTPSTTINNSALTKANSLWKSSLMYSEDVETSPVPSPCPSPTPSPSKKRENISSASSVGASSVVDIYRDGIAKLIPNSSGQYDIDLRSGSDSNNNEESRFADFSFWVSEYTPLCDKIFTILANIITSVLPNFAYEREEFSKLFKSQLHVADLWSVIYSKENMPGAVVVTNTGGSVGNVHNDNLVQTNIVNANSFNHHIYTTITNANLNLNNYANNALYNHILAVYNNHADSLQNAIVRLYINNKIGEKVIKIFLYWYREGVRDISIGGVLWKKAYAMQMASNVWGVRRHNLDGHLSRLSDLVTTKTAVHSNAVYTKIYNNIFNINKTAWYRLDYCLGPDLCRRRIVRDFTNYNNTFFAHITNKFVPTGSGGTDSGGTGMERTETKANTSTINLLLKQVKKNLIKSSSVSQDEVEELDPALSASMLMPPENEMESDQELEEEVGADERIEEEVLMGGATLPTTLGMDAKAPGLGSTSSVPTAQTGKDGVASGAPSNTNNALEMGQYKSLMIKEILRGIIGSHELKTCRFYNIERIFGLEAQAGLLILTPASIHLISGFKCISADTTKAFNELAFDYIYVHHGIKQLSSPGAEAAPTGSLDERHASLNAINNDRLPPVYVQGVYTTVNSTIGALYGASNSVQTVYQVCGEQAWMHEIWIEMLESETFYDKIKIEDIHSFYKRRYQLRNSALEVADTRGHAVLFSCESAEYCDEILIALLEHDLPSCIFNKLVGLKNIQLLRGANNIYARLLQMFIHNITALWQSNHLSNLEYLMYLNSAAGRSYLDLTQYPVFPWVLSDYTSEELDLNEVDSFRNLNIPMGCIGVKRKQQFVERYSMMTDLYDNTDEEDGRDSIENIPFHYGTHYSCAGYVLYYLIRMQPYTNMYIALQDGHFDKADRLFCNVAASYNSAAHENLQDVRELIPEFYYLPNFLVNSNNLHFGATQKGEVINHVTLPAWAKGSPHMYVYKHRQALESKLVSENLHSWIDLIFGYKSRGKASIQSINAFMRITYEDEIAIDEIDDPIVRAALVAQINNFGICAKQLFTKPHIRKYIPEVVKYISNPGLGGGGGGSGNTGSSDSIVLVEPTALAWHAHMCPPLCVVGAAQFTILTKVALQQATYANAMKGEGVGDIRLLSRDKLLACPLHSKLLSSKRAIRFQALPQGIVIQNLATLIGQRALETEKEVSFHEQLHLKRITCVASCKHGKTIVTGSEDCSVRVWHLLSVQQQRKLSLLGILAGHTAPVTCVEMSPELNVIVSGSQDGTVCIWDAISLSLMFILPHHTGPIVSVGINPVAAYVLVMAADQLRLYTINGELLGFENFNLVGKGSTDLADPGQAELTTSIKDSSSKLFLSSTGSEKSEKRFTSAEVGSAGSCMIAVPCGDWQDGVVAVTGHTDGSIFLWKLGSELVAALYPLPSSVVPTQTDFTMRRLFIACAPSKTHRSEITCLKLCNPAPTVPNSTNRNKEVICRAFAESRNLELLVGDREGVVSRWSTLKLDQVTQLDLNSLLATASLSAKK